MNLDMDSLPPASEFQQLSPTGTSDYTPPQLSGAVAVDVTTENGPSLPTPDPETETPTPDPETEIPTPDPETETPAPTESPVPCEPLIETPHAPAEIVEPELSNENDAPPAVEPEAAVETPEPEPETTEQAVESEPETPAETADPVEIVPETPASVETPAPEIPAPENPVEPLVPEPLPPADPVHETPLPPPSQPPHTEPVKTEPMDPIGTPLAHDDEFVVVEPLEPQDPIGTPRHVELPTPEHPSVEPLKESLGPAEPQAPIGTPRAPPGPIERPRRAPRQGSRTPSPPKIPTGEFHQVDDEAYEPTYNEAFPPLADGDASTGMSHPSQLWNQPGISWAQKPVLSAANVNTVTQVFHVPLEERRLQDHRFGDQAEQAKICQDIQAKVGGVAVETSVAKDQSLTVLLTGKPEQVLKAKNLLTSQLQTQVVTQIPIPPAHHGAILGKNGKRLQDLESSTATKIHVPRAHENSDLIRVVGTKEGVDKARHEIQMISDELAKKAIEKLNIPKMYHPFICGPDNKVQQAIQQATGARINVVPPSVQKDEIVVNGEKEGVAQAVKAIMQIYQDKVKTTRSIQVQVKKAQHKYIIGPRGSGIQEILAEFDVSVEVPPLESTSETITLVGAHKNLGSALNMVYSKADSVVSETVEAKAWLHRFIIGRNGANVKNITADLPKVHIEFCEEEEKITLEGPPEEVKAAREALETLIADLTSRMDMCQIKVDPKFHRFVIGKNGANLKRIKAETGVSINVPSETVHSDVIRIEGDKAGVQVARQQLQDMVAKMENERTRSVIIESRFHRTLIGTKGEQIRETRDKFNQVQITFPDEGKKSDIVSLRGPSDDVERCAKYLQQMNKDLVEKNHQLQVYILKQYHKNIIGKSGATIKQIRDDTDTRIDLPSELDSSNMITITGKKANCEAAKKRLLQIGEEQASIKEITIDIPHKLHNSIIGAKGRLIKSVMDDCPGVMISFPKEQQESNKVSIRGPSDEVENARKQLLDLSKERQEASHVAEVKSKPEFHKFLIGKNGINIKKVRDSTGARIVFPSSQDEDQETITVIGKKEAVEKGKAELLELIKNLENSLETEMTVDQKFHSHFVARRCEVLRQLGDEYGGVSVSFPRQGVQSDRVTIKGPKDCVIACKARIGEIVDDLASQVTVECVIPQKHHRRVMGAKGHNVEDISSRFNVKIKFPDRPPAGHANGDATAVNGDAVNGETASDEGEVSKYDIIVITGKPDNCQAASQAFQDLVPITELVDVPHRFHRFIIGQKGRDVRRMMEEFEVNISIPQAEEQLDTITVSGAPANAARAIDAIQQRLEVFLRDEKDKELKGYSLTLEVKQVYHPKIIGRKGAVISQIRDQHDVNIQFPERGAENEELITITGYQDKAQAARDAIMDIVNKLDEMVTEELFIDPRVHARVIGQRGKAVRNIMDRYKVDIRFPSRDSANPGTVTVMGAPDDVDDCLDHLQNLTEEYEQDLAEEDEMKKYMKPPSQKNESGRGGPAARGFTVRDAPWDTASTDDFPSIGAPAPAPARTSFAWGPSGRR